jgi:hypothetical protein
MGQEILTFGNIAGGDFEDNELYITMDKDIIIQANRVAVIVVSSPEQEKQITEFINNLK